ncbi:hypothetical protein A11A3_06111 [Alcanivorax hongdengensis A-11-3]|uniref:DUF58 domain-containing protein n=1 Tax=Alcanivorax hongdengensis A-11-3 TaxID=1177179 RepID=L0WGQ9_9GAMM|nr:DUF58 domain-containing protein [Alcanivorax hongdengensis]EKF75005.1 hypothetical protein A11A3_06111 [Alcanivorax hongdengensis A-11-3]
MKPAVTLLWLVAAWALLATPLPWLSPLWSQLWLAVGGLALVVSLLDLRQARRRPTPQAERLLPDALSVQQSHTVRIQVAPRGLPRRFVLADHHPDDDDRTGLPVTLNAAGGGRITEVTYPYRPARRGPVAFGDLEFWLPSPLTLWQVRKVCPAERTVPVYPDFSRISRADMDINHAFQLTGNRMRPRRGEGMEFHQLREYRPGDSLRQIDWKATARRRQLISREYQDEQNQQVLVMLDGGRRMAMPVGEMTGFDHGLNAALLLAWTALKQKDKAGAMLFSGDSSRWLPPVQGQQGLNQLLNGLYDLHPSRHASDFNLAARQLLGRWRRRALVVLVTRLQQEDEDDLVTAVSLLRRHHLVLIADMLLPEQVHLAHQPVADFDQALTLAADAREQLQRQQLHTRLRHAGALVTASVPQQLPARLSNLYLMLKRSGRL